MKETYKNISHSFQLRNGLRWEYGEVKTREQIEASVLNKPRGGISVDKQVDKIISDLLYQQKIEKTKEKKESD